MIKYSNFILEGKFWYKTISQFLQWLKENANRNWIFIDTETTGLDVHNGQLTQISSIVSEFNYDTCNFSEISVYNKKIRLTDEIKNMMDNTNSKIKKILSFNHYGQKGVKYHDEQDTIQDFYNWINQYDNALLVIQNASFDMKFLNVRSNTIRIKKEVFDTKVILQLFYLPLIQKLAETSDEFKKLVFQIGTSERDNGLISSSMSKVGPALGLDMKNYHDGLTDCKITQKMMEKVLRLLKEYKNIDISKYQIERIKTI